MTYHHLGQVLKEEFPLLRQQPDLVFLDNAASTQKPEAVLAAMDKFYRTAYANVHRGVYSLSEEATTQYENARQTVAQFINAASREEVIFTKNATAALNLIAFSLARQLNSGDEVLLSEAEHHANLVPWQVAAARYGLKLKFIPLNQEGRLDLTSIDRVLSARTKILAITAMSNVTGAITDLEKIIPTAHARHITVVVDAAQAIQHLAVDVQAWGCDVLVFSAHKIFGPTGLGVLWGKLDLLHNLEPFEYGGSMIEEVSLDKSTYTQPPTKFEAGTPPITEAIGLAAAINFIKKLDYRLIQTHEEELINYVLDRLPQVPGLRLIGPSQAYLRGPVFSFVIDGLHPHDVASILDSVGVCVRAGHHCAMPLHKKFGLTATTRASFTIYNSEADVNALIAGLNKARQLLII